MRILKNLLAIIMVLLLMVACVIALCQRDYAIQRYEKAESTVYCLETFTRLQADTIEMWVKVHREIAIACVDLQEDIRVYKALNEAMEGRIQKMAGAYHIRELNLLERIRELEENHVKDQEKQTRT
jgi:hypothetical protein